MFYFRLMFVCSLFTIFETEARTCDKSILTHKNYNLLMRTKNTCGRGHSANFTDNPVRGRIYNGIITEHKEVPWLVHLRIRFTVRTPKPTTYCVGSLITDRYVLTAALCIAPQKSPRVTALIGQNIKGPFFSRNNHQCVCPAETSEIIVEQIIKHAGFDSHNLNNICLMRLSRTVQFDDYVKPICLPLSCLWQEKHLTCLETLVAGFGYQHLDRNLRYDRSPDIVRRFRAEVASRADCFYGWQNVGQAFKATESHICATNDNDTGACPADFGAPMMLETSVRGQSVFYLIGLFSEGWTCKEHDSSTPPAVYTRVTYFLRWILDNIRA